MNDPVLTGPPGHQPTDASPAGTAESDWIPLYRIGGAAAVLLVVLTAAHSAVFFVAGLPTTVVEWFALFQRNALLGLLAFELLPVVYVVLSIPLVLALSVALRRAAPSLTALYLALSLVGIVAFVAARPAFEMLSLSAGHAAAASDAQRAPFLAAGEAMLAVFSGTAFWVSYVLGSVGGLLISAAMLRTTVFSKTTAYLRLASSVLDFGLFVPTIGLFISLLSVACLVAFNIQVARRLFQLAGGGSAHEAVRGSRHSGRARPTSTGIPRERSLPGRPSKRRRRRSAWC